MREVDMIPPLVAWLKQTRRIRHDSVVVEEFPWLGRRVDLATLTISGRLTAYETKVKQNSKAIEQAAKNAQAFERSYIVTGTTPLKGNLRLANCLGIGVLVLENGGIRTVLESPRVQQPDEVLTVLRNRMRQQAGYLMTHV
jgi:hypothetical protein